MAKKIALYTRISTFDQSHERQIYELKQYVESRYPGEEYELYSDTASGAKSTRPQFMKLKLDVRAQRISRVIVVKLDRFARSLTDMMNTIKELEENKVPFISINDDINLESATGRLTLSLLTAFSAFELELMKERINSGIAQAKRDGKHCGRPVLITDRDKVRKLRAEGVSFRTIAKTCKISVGSVQKILKAS